MKKYHIKVKDKVVHRTDNIKEVMKVITVVDNYLDVGSFKVISETLNGRLFPWFFSEEKVVLKEVGLFNYQFTHYFFKNFTINSTYFDILNPLIEKMDVKSLVRIKANLNPISHKLIEFESHKDQEYKCKAAIYYINDNNGYTMFGNEKVESKQNRIVFFDTETEHSSTNSTDCKNRMVINFNYFDSKDDLEYEKIPYKS